MCAPRRDAFQPKERQVGNRNDSGFDFDPFKEQIRESIGEISERFTESHRMEEDSHEER